MKQKNDAEKEHLLKKKQELTNELYTLHNLRSIKKYAQEELGLTQVNITQVKRLNHG